MKKKLSHLDDHGQAKMVDVGGKPITHRVARAEATLHMKASTLKELTATAVRKGDVLAVARIAGIQAAKRTHELIPLCHDVPLSSVAVHFIEVKPDSLRIETEAHCEARTGVEMEALVAANIAALTVYDMLKSVDRGMEISRVRLLEKSGGLSGEWSAAE